MYVFILFVGFVRFCLGLEESRKNDDSTNMNWREILNVVAKVKMREMLTWENNRNWFSNVRYGVCEESIS